MLCKRVHGTMSLQQRIQEAQSSRLDISSLISRPLYQLVSAHAHAIGCPVEFVFYPILSATASCIGVNGHIRIHSSWCEPAIMWFVVAAKKGEKKTAALKVVKTPLERLQAEMSEKWKCDTSEHKPKTPPQLLVDNFSFEELHCIMPRNGCQTLGLFDEMSSFYAQLDLFKHSGITMISYSYLYSCFVEFQHYIIMWFLHGTDTTVGSDFDKKTLITLNGGGSWARNFRCYSATLPRTCFNVTGQP